MLNEEQVQALLAEGKASFSTKYETETKTVDEHGNPVQSAPGMAPDHPDAEGVNPDTKKLGGGKRSEEVNLKEVEASSDGAREEKLRQAKPASDASEATK